MKVQICENQQLTSSEVPQNSFFEPPIKDAKAISPSRSHGLSSGALKFGSVLPIVFYFLISISSFLGINVLFFEKFTQRGIIPILTVFLFFFGIFSFD